MRLYLMVVPRHPSRLERPRPHGWRIDGEVIVDEETKILFEKMAEQVGEFGKSMREVFSSALNRIESLEALVDELKDELSKSYGPRDEETCEDYMSREGCKHMGSASDDA